MAQWKRIRVKVNGRVEYRWTDGKGNYRLANPNSSNKLSTWDKLASYKPEALAIRKNAARRVHRGINTAVEDAVNKVKTDFSNFNTAANRAFGIKPQPNKGKGGAKPPYTDGQIVEKEGNKFRYSAKTKQFTLVKEPKKPETKPQPEPPKNPRAEQQTTTTRTPPKPKPKKPAPGYQKSESGYYRGTSAESRSKYEAELAKKSGSTSGNPLLDRFRRDMGRDAKTGERQYSTPADKSQYVDKNGKLKIQDKPKPQPVAAKPKPKPPTTKTGGNTPASGVSFTASEEAKGRSGFNPRGTDRPRVIPPGYKWDPKLKRVVKK